MAAVPIIEFTEEQLNYYRICYVVTDIITDGLRSIFKQEWDKRYKATFGEWKDTPGNGMHFNNIESQKKEEDNGNLLAIMEKGKTAEWDCIMLFYAILFSRCIGDDKLEKRIEKHVHNLRKFRNEEFAHLPKKKKLLAKFVLHFKGFVSLPVKFKTSRIREVFQQRS